MLCPVSLLTFTGEIRAANREAVAFFLDGKRSSRGGWTWQHTQQPVEHFKWAPGQPDNQRNIQHCIAVKAETEKWEDIHCNIKLKAICQYP